MNEALKKEVLLKYYPDQCTMMVDEDIDAIVAGPVKLDRSDYGSNADLYYLFVSLGNVVEFISNVISIYQASSSSMNKDEILDKMKSKTTETTKLTSIDENNKTLIIEHVIEKIKYH